MRLAKRAGVGAATARTAALIAEAQLGVLPGWFAGDIDATPEQLVGALMRMVPGLSG
ncbi:hypothetical protein [Dokdonella fugitiva]|jgi:hypothetical protein|uniref:Uncharacterized protein n=1 Tax=Dokdonella fugitiva TaxID=328517 RepID=A0A4R2HZ15_9GAMM|nr:hypothetical protein [Dokdonella fugitiva]MBA8883074.1 hypothetical protein [Dokdonella fugitiva]TCO36536.1 hypothetical protein EV148_11220 [Dokdonella fugitiva]